MSPPPRWTFDPEELDCEGDWLANDSFGHALITDYKLGPCTPLMCRQDNMGGGEVIFESGDKLFLHDQISGDLYQLIRPATLDEAIASMKGERKGRLAWKRYSSGGHESA
jgi:hypothetical protein